MGQELETLVKRGMLKALYNTGKIGEPQFRHAMEQLGQEVRR